MTQVFPGFRAETLTFLEGLKANNNRDWFTENKPVYERAVKQPAEQFCAVMEEKIQGLTGLHHTSKIFRVHRDVRFSKDKTPYNAHLHISFIPQSPLSSPPAWFFGLEPGQLTLGTGVFGFDKQALDTFRDRVGSRDGAGLAKQIQICIKSGMRISEPELKRVPAPFPTDHPRADLLRHKGLAVWLDLPETGAVAGPEAVSTCLAGFEQVKPVFDWLAKTGDI